MKERVYIGVGSNLGDRESHIAFAAERVGLLLEEFESSKLYETLPRYNEDQPRFINCAFTGLCDMDPEQLLEKVLDIERERGRDRSGAGWMGPRPLDIDILLFGDRIIDSEILSIPHPRITERKFVLVPLLDLDPLLREPGSGRLYIDILGQVGPQGIYYYTMNSV